MVGTVLLISLLRWKISLDGTVKLKGTSISSNGVVKFGSGRFGFALVPQKFISVGPYQKPWFQFSIKKTSPDKKPQEKPTMKKRSLYKFIRPSLKTFRWEVFSLTGNLGFKNPADTGIVFGGIQALRGWICTKRIQLDIQPRFTHHMDTELTGTLKFSLVPARLAWNLTKTYLHFRSQKG